MAMSLATIALVQNVNQNDGLGLVGGNPFARIMVLVTLGNPRKKFLGAILSLSTEGLSLCGVELVLVRRSKISGQGRRAVLARRGFCPNAPGRTHGTRSARWQHSIVVTTLRQQNRP